MHSDANLTPKRGNVTQNPKIDTESCENSPRKDRIPYLGPTYDGFGFGKAKICEFLAQEVLCERVTRNLTRGWT